MPAACSSDPLNDPRDFIALLDASGPMRFLAKHHIAEIRSVE